jgi:hypothetical protein
VSRVQSVLTWLEALEAEAKAPPRSNPTPVDIMLDEDPIRSLIETMRPSPASRAGWMRTGFAVLVGSGIVAVMYLIYYILSELLWEMEDQSRWEAFLTIVKLLCYGFVLVGLSAEMTAKLPSIEHGICFAWALFVILVSESGVLVGSNAQEKEFFRTFLTRALVIVGFAVLVYKSYLFTAALISWIRTVRDHRRRNTKAKKTAVVEHLVDLDKVVDVTCPVLILLIVLSVYAYIFRPSLSVGPCHGMRGKTGITPYLMARCFNYLTFAALKWSDAYAVLITNGASPRGMQHAQHLASCQAEVVLCAGSLLEAQNAALMVSQRTGYSVSAKQLDLASVESVRAFAEEWTASRAPLHVLVNNADEAGAIKVAMTADGVERIMQVLPIHPHCLALYDFLEMTAALILQVNFLSQMLLTELLLPTLQESAPARIVHITSEAHRWGKASALSEV